MPHLASGIAPGGGLFVVREEVLGLNRACHPEITHGSFTAQEALSWGAVAEVVPLGQVLTRAQELAHQMTQRPTRDEQIHRRCVPPAHQPPPTSPTYSRARPARAGRLGSQTHAAASYTIGASIASWAVYSGLALRCIWVSSSPARLAASLAGASRSGSARPGRELPASGGSGGPPGGGAEQHGRRLDHRAGGNGLRSGRFAADGG